MKLSHADAPPPFQPGKPVGNVYNGACSWTDRTLIDAGTFYPQSVRTAADRLAHYASQFPIVEVDATYYALPSERNAHLWVKRYLYTEEELKGWVAPIRGLAEQADRVHMLMNNCYGDYGVRNARQLAELLAGHA